MALNSFNDLSANPQNLHRKLFVLAIIFKKMFVITQKLAGKSDLKCFNKINPDFDHFVKFILKQDQNIYQSAQNTDSTDFEDIDPLSHLTFLSMDEVDQFGEVENVCNFNLFELIPMGFINLDITSFGFRWDLKFDLIIKTIESFKIKEISISKAIGFLYNKEQLMEFLTTIYIKEFNSTA